MGVRMWNSQHLTVSYYWMIAGAEREIEVMEKVKDCQEETLNFCGKDKLESEGNPWRHGRRQPFYSAVTLSYTIGSYTSILRLSKINEASHRNSEQ